MEYYSQIKKRTRIILKDIINNTDSSDKVDEIDDYLFTLFRPKVYSGKAGAEVTYMKSFEEACIIITRFSGKDAKKMTLLEYYQCYKMIKKVKPPNKRK